MTEEPTEIVYKLCTWGHVKSPENVYKDGTCKVCSKKATERITAKKERRKELLLTKKPSSYTRGSGGAQVRANHAKCLFYRDFRLSSIGIELTKKYSTSWIPQAHIRNTKEYAMFIKEYHLKVKSSDAKIRNKRSDIKIKNSTYQKAYYRSEAGVARALKQRASDTFKENHRRYSREAYHNLARWAVASAIGIPSSLATEELLKLKRAAIIIQRGFKTWQKANQ